MTNVTIRGQCGKYGWVMRGGVALLYWWFLVGSVFSLMISVYYSSLVWVKSTVSRMMVSISPYETSLVVYSFLICPASSGAMAELVGEFLFGLTYSYLPSLPPKLASNVTSLSGSTGSLDDAA